MDNDAHEQAALRDLDRRDARGHGRSPGPRGYSPSIGVSIRDVNDFVGEVSRVSGQPVENVAVVAQSVGAVYVSAWLHDYAPKIRCAVLASPAFKVKLYELFGDNDMVSRSLAGIGDAVPHGGFLVHTGQPWHPQLELIARALTSHRGGEAWVMRRRSQREMDQLVERAGFRKLEQRIDEWGIFTVSLAVREAPKA